MNNTDLQKMLQRFPQGAQIEVEGPSKTLMDLDRVEMSFDADPIALGQQNTSWSDLIQEKIKIRFVASPRVKTSEGSARG